MVIHVKLNTHNLNAYIHLSSDKMYILKRLIQFEIYYSVIDCLNIGNHTDVITSRLRNSRKIGRLYLVFSSDIGELSP